MKTIMDGMSLHRTIIRLSHEVEERSEGLEGVVLVGVKRGGEVVANRIAEYFLKTEGIKVPCAGIDISMTRDDLQAHAILPDAVQNKLDFSISGKKVVLCDDVLHTGRSAVAAIEALFQLGRPKKIQLLVLIDRGGRELPVRADYVGRNVPTSHTEYVQVNLKEMGADEDSLAIVKGNEHEA